MELDQNRRQELRQKHEQIAHCKDMLFGEAKTSDNKVLNELTKKLNAYLDELPMLGFNSGKFKYNLNTVKEFLIPYLIEHHPIKFTVKRTNNHVSQDKISEAPRYFELCCTRLQLCPVPESLQVRAD